MEIDGVFKMMAEALPVLRHLQIVLWPCRDFLIAALEN
jgi:hypothetical protein